MKKTILQLVALAIVSLFCCSCEDNSSGKYPYDTIRFYVDNNVPIKHPTQVINATSWGDWNAELYPMEVWIEETDIATVDNQGYVTGHKIGTFTLHAKVMGKHGLIEDSKQFTVSDALTYLTINQIWELQALGVDKNNDEIITASELEQTEFFTEPIYSNFLLSLAQYLPNLKEVSVIADTTQSRTLDLSMFKLKKLQITDICAQYAKNENYPNVIDDVMHQKYQPYFLTSLVLNNTIEHLIVGYLPGFDILDLSQYSNLKYFQQIALEGTRNWKEINYILPVQISKLNMHLGGLQYSDMLPNLSTIEAYEPLNVVLNKQYIPNLKSLKCKKYWLSSSITSLDISTYSEGDLNDIFIDVDTLYLSQSFADNIDRYAIFADNIIIK